MASLKDKIKLIKEKAEKDLWFFAQLVNPQFAYGEVHKNLFQWWTREEAKDNQLVLLPRDHLKSHCAAVRAAWEVTRDPTITILYLSATATLAERQLYAIKNILESDVYRTYWPEMINPDEGKRARWTVDEVIVDHPLRKKEAIRDSTITAGGITKNITGLHANMVFLDDMVVPGNAYTEDGRDKVAAIYSQLSSIETTGAKEVIVGTRYHPKDLYSVIKEIKEPVYDDETNELISEEPVYEILEEVVEVDNIFLWPRTRGPNGKYYGFDRKELERKKAKYTDKTQFYSQYYNNPNDVETQRISRDKFQYYDKKYVTTANGNWYFKDRKLNVFASIDFAFSLSRKADFTAIVVIGVDSENNIYILDIDRFKTDGKISVYFKHILDLHIKWGFSKMRAEINAAQASIVKELKEVYIKQYGLSLRVDEFRPTTREGSKEERVSSILEPKYDNQQIWHYKGGLCNTLEEEVIMNKPPHDDVKDALASAIDIAIAPKRSFGSGSIVTNNVIHYNRFGGVS